MRSSFCRQQYRALVRRIQPAIGVLAVLAPLIPLPAIAQGNPPTVPGNAGRGGQTAEAQQTTQEKEGTLDVSQVQNGNGNNGIFNSLQQCASLPHACQLLAPALYSQAEQLKWEFVNYGYGATAPQYGSAQSATLLDQRFGGQYETVLNPYTVYPGAGSDFGGGGNVYAGDAHKVFFGRESTGASLNQNYKGQLFSCVHTQGGSLSQIYDNVNQSFFDCVNVVADRSTSEAGFAYMATYQASSPGDAVLYGGNLLGPAGYNHRFDEGLELASQLVSETINVYRGTVASTPSSQSLTITPASAGPGESIAGTQGDGRYLLITSSGVRTLTPAAVTGYAGQTINGADFSYFSSVTAGAPVPVSTATGTLTSPVKAPYGSETVNFRRNSGRLAAGIACIADQKNTGRFGQQPVGNFEMVNITSLGSGSFTAVFHKSHPVGGTYWQGGDCGKFIELVADTLPSGSAWSNGEGGSITHYPVRYPYPVLGSLDGADLIVFTASNDGKQNPFAFGSAWQNSSTKTANLYDGAEVYSVAGANDDLRDNVFTLAPNNAGFATGQSVEESHLYAQKASAGKFSMSQWSPSGQVNGPDYFLTGRVEYPSAGVTVYNHNPWTSYINGGGAWTPPLSAFSAIGSWMYGYYWNSFRVGQVYDLLGATTPSANSTIGLIGFGTFGQSPDQFSYTTPASGGPKGGKWGFSGNVAVAGSVQAQAIALGTIINTESRIALTAKNKNVIANAARGAQTIALPSCSAQSEDAAPAGLEYTIIKSDSSPNTVTLQAARSQTIDYNGQVARTLAIASAGARTLVCAPDSNWYAY